MTAISMRQMLEAGAHFGHQTRYWNPQMAPYIFGARNNIHIIDLQQTLPLFNDATNYLGKMASHKGNVLFVGTKKVASKIVVEEAQRCGMPYVNHRWLGGMLTNFKTIKKSIARLKTLETMKADGSMEHQFSKKEALGMTCEMEKLNRSLGGIKDMQGIPDALFVIDVGYEKNAVNEAKTLGIPVVGIVDSNNSPQNIDYIIPGNDDSIRIVKLYCQSVATAILEAKAALALAVPAETGDVDDMNAEAAKDTKHAVKAAGKAKKKGATVAVKTKDNKTLKVATAKVKGDKVATTEVKKDEVATAEVKKDEVATTEAKKDEVATAKVKEDEVATTEVKKDEVATTEVKKDEVATTEVKKDEVVTAEVKEDEETTTKKDASLDG